MTIRDRAISAIRELPEDTDILGIIRELSFIAGVEEASSEIAQGQGIDSTAAKKKLREWVSG